tara:strand:- start:672 stop:899 length:228 start_codon:yes stop_codon:yes gene_type:complete
MPKAENVDLSKQKSLNSKLVNDESIDNIPTRCNLKFYKKICIVLGISTIVTITNILITNYIIDIKNKDDFGSCSC